jgi:hypothetical protein
VRQARATKQRIYTRFSNPGCQGSHLSSTPPTPSSGRKTVVSKESSIIGPMNARIACDPNYLQSRHSLDSEPQFLMSLRPRSSPSPRHSLDRNENRQPHQNPESRRARTARTSIKNLMQGRAGHHKPNWGGHNGYLTNPPPPGRRGTKEQQEAEVTTTARPGREA